MNILAKKVKLLRIEETLSRAINAVHDDETRKKLDKVLDQVEGQLDQLAREFREHGQGKLPPPPSFATENKAEKRPKE